MKSNKDWPSMKAIPFARAKLRLRTRSKYRNVPTMLNGERFASKKEATRHAELLLLQKANHIQGLERQPRIHCVVNHQNICAYVGDWRYTEKIDGVWRVVVEDAKGVQTREFKLKWKLVKALYPGIYWRMT